MSSPTITCLKILDGEVQWNAPLSDLQAVTQIIYTRLNLFQGEWWASITDGLPLWQSIVGHGASAAAQQQMAVLIGQRILDTPYVTGLSNVVAVFNQQTRKFISYSASVTTEFGVVQLTNIPIPAALQ